MRIPYLPARAVAPLPSLGGGLIRPRPVMVVRITGPGRAWLRDGLLDTGSDDTVFEERYALLGYAGFLKYFDADFRGDDLQVVLNPNRSFPGVRI